MSNGNEVGVAMATAKEKGLADWWASLWDSLQTEPDKYRREHPVEEYYAVARSAWLDGWNSRTAWDAKQSVASGSCGATGRRGDE